MQSTLLLKCLHRVEITHSVGKLPDTYTCPECKTNFKVLAAGTGLDSLTQPTAYWEDVLQRRTHRHTREDENVNILPVENKAVGRHRRVASEDSHKLYAAIVAMGPGKALPVQFDTPASSLDVIDTLKDVDSLGRLNKMKVRRQITDNDNGCLIRFSIEPAPVKVTPETDEAAPVDEAARMWDVPTVTETSGRKVKNPTRK